MADIVQLAQEHADLSEKKQVQAGEAIAGRMNEEHEQFMLMLVKLVDDGTINLIEPASLLQEAYKSLDDVKRGKVDLALINITDQIRHIYDFYKSEQTPNASPHLQTMVEHLWQMKSKLEEEYGDVLKI